MPSVAAHGTRYDVAYLDTRGPSTFDAYQTSFDGAARGLDISLTTGRTPLGFDPGAGDLGDRADAVSFGTLGTLFAYFPDIRGGTEPSVTETEVDHGTVPPKLTVPTGDLTTGKNRPLTVGGMVPTGLGWLGYSDPDGDPVTFTVDPPAHGTISGNTYTPTYSYAGPDAITVRAVEAGGPTVQATHNLTITNQAPVFDAPEPAIVDEGGEVVVPLHATDADVGDIVNFTVMTPAPAPFNVAGRATTDANGNLHLKIPAGVRVMAPVTLTLRATDTTTGPVPAGFAQESIDITVRPNLKTPLIQMDGGNVSTTGRRVIVTAPVTWADAAASCLAATVQTCHVRHTWTFGDGSASPPPTIDDPSMDHLFPGPGLF